MQRSRGLQRGTRLRQVVRSAGLIASIAFVLSQGVPASAATTVGLWHMDESSGTTAYDSSGLHFDGTLTDVRFVAPGFDGTGGAYSFNGTSSQVKIDPNSNALNPGTQNISITVHVKFTALPSVGVYDLVRKQGLYAGTRNFYTVAISSKGQAMCLFKGDAGHKAKAVWTPAINDGNWHTITCSRTWVSTQAEAVIVTVDGQSFVRGSMVGYLWNYAPLVLGGQKAGTKNLYNGLMDEVSIAIG